METLLQDLRYSLRRLGKSPGFTGTAVLLLTVGIGTSTAVFTAASHVLLRGLDVDRPDQLAQLKFDDTANHIVGTEFSYPAFEIFSQPNPLISGMLARSEPVQVNITSNRISDIAHAVFDSPNAASVLGLSPALGRLFNSGDARPSGESPPIVLSYTYWQRHFGGDRRVIGKTVTVNTTPFVIAGVNPAKFHGIEVGIDPDVMLPAYTVDQIRGIPTLNNRAGWGFTIICRRKLGVTEEQIRASLAPVFAAVLNDTPSAVPASMASQMKQWVSKLRFRVDSASLGASSSSRSQLREPLFILMAITGLVFLVTCANLAGLLLSKTEARTSEIGVRLALGCAKRRLLGQLLIESTLLTMVGGGFGVLAAFGISPLIPPLLGSPQLSGAIRPDLATLGYGLVLALVGGLLVGFIPALRATRLDPMASIRTFSFAVGFRNSRIARMLIVCQVAVSLVLALTAGQFVRSLENYENLDAGFRPDHLILVSVRPDLVKYDNRNKIDYERRISARLAELPGVKSVTFSTSALGQLTWNTLVKVPGYTPKATLDDTAGRNIVGPGFVETLGLKLIAGRDFDARDNQGSPATVIVNESFVRHFFGNEDVLGRQVSFIDSAKRADTIIGIVGDALDRGVKKPPKPVIYSSYEHDPLGSLTFSIRVLRDPEAMLNEVASVFKTIDSRVPIQQIRTEEAQMDAALEKERMLAALSGMLGALAMLVAMVGLYGLLAYSIVRRTREIGLRVALGASGTKVQWLAIRESICLLLYGIVLGCPIYLAISRLLRAQVFHVQPADPIALAGALLLLMLCGGIATYIPARRALRVDPMVALRYE